VGPFYVISKYFIAVDKSKLSEPAKMKVRLLKPSQISKLIMDRDTDEPAEEDEGGWEEIKSPT
jgi:hypothetical protein